MGVPEIPRAWVATLVFGAAIGLAVPVGVTLLSGGSVLETTDGALATHTAPPASGTVSTAPPTTSHFESGSAPTAGPTASATAIPAAKPTPVSIKVKLGGPAERGTYGVTTPVAALGQYITWRLIVPAVDAGKAFDVQVATRLDGAWTGWSKLTSRVADARGSVVFSWRQRTPAWIKVRFALPSGSSKALQGRWR